MRTEQELNFLEKLIPELAESATKTAYLKTLSRGGSVTEIKNGKLVITASNGTQTIIRDAKSSIAVPRNA